MTIMTILDLDAIKDVLTEAENDFRHSEPLKNLRFAVLNAPADAQAEVTI
jgi:hypothetical protein